MKAITLLATAVVVLATNVNLASASTTTYWGQSGQYLGFATSSQSGTVFYGSNGQYLGFSTTTR